MTATLLTVSSHPPCAHCGGTGGDAFLPSLDDPKATGMLVCWVCGEDDKEVPTTRKDPLWSS